MENISKTESLEFDALVNCIHQCCGYDFRHYARASLLRIIKREVETEKLSHISEIIPLILHNPKKLQKLLHNLSINVTDFFRDPELYNNLVEKVFPVLKSFPFIKVWSAGCATGKEVYSLAILLKEAGLLERTQIYATDFNHSVLSYAKSGVFPLHEIERCRDQYRRSGGAEDLDRYFHTKYNLAKIDRELSGRVTFAHHNLATDSVFSEMQLIVCKNVMIYFNNQLKERVGKLFYDSLCQGGYLCLGTTESLSNHNDSDDFLSLSGSRQIYKKNILEIEESSSHSSVVSQ